MFGKNKVKKEGKLPFFKFLAWKTSDVTSAAAFLIVTTYLSMFCTDFLGMSPAVVGTILLVSNIVDLITDFVGALIVDNTNTKLGKGRPYELGIIGMAICTMLLYATPNGWSQTIKILWVFFVYTFEFGVFNTLRGAGQTAYFCRAFSNRTVAGKVSSYGGLVTTFGSMIVSITFPTMMAKMATSAEGWLPLVAIYMVPLGIIGLGRFIFVKEDIDLETAKSEKINVKSILEMMKVNKYAWVYGGMMLLYNIVTSMGTVSYYWKYVVGDMTMMGVLSVFSILILPLMLFFPLLLKKFSPAQIIAVTSAIAGVGYIIAFFAVDNIPLLMLSAFISAFAAMPMNYFGILLIMDLCVYNQHKGIPRMEASVSAIFNGFGTQLGQGIGGALTGFLLTAAGYIAAEGDVAVAQPDSAIMMIRCLHTLVPMLMMLGIAVLGAHFAKLSKQVPELEKEIETKKESGNLE